MARKGSFFTPQVAYQALIGSFVKLNPRHLWRNPVMLSVEIGSFITTVSFLYALVANGQALFFGLVAVWLWLTVIFANFAESVAEIKGKAKADELRRTRSNLMAKQLKEKRFGIPFEMVPAGDLKKGDLILVQTGDTIPADGEIVDGAAVINESAVTGESAPVIREAGGDRCSVVAGTKVISNEIIVRVTVNQGEAFLDKLISMIETAKRPKTPNEIALETLLLALTAIFVFVCANFWSLSVYSVNAVGHGTSTDVVVLVALFVCLAPTTIAALLPAIGIAGMDRLFGKNVIALSGRAIEASGDIDTILLDKTGTITHGNRQAVSFIPVNGHTEKEVAEAAYIASLNDETPEGKSTVDLALKKYGVDKKVDVSDYKPILFSAQTRMSGADVSGHKYRKGAPDSIENYVLKNGGAVHPGTNDIVTEIARTGGTPLLVGIDNDIYGVIHLKDVLKEGIRDRIARVQAMGIKTVLITGDNPLTAAHIAREAGIDEYVAQAKPEDKLRIVKEKQAEGIMVAMTGDGTNDAPALAQADVGVAMSAGTQVAREAANMVDLDNDPSKLIDIVRIGKEILMTRGALTTFSIANDVAKYFVIIPAALYTVYPQLGVLDFLGLHSPESAILSAVIFNAIIIVLLIPLALRGVKFRPTTADRMFVQNLLLYGVGGVIVPFIGIKLIDLLIGVFI
jgi:potassium-transporting ATPase ATP-binding subunit